jgi:hypothetical protein
MQPAIRAYYKLEELWTAPKSRKRGAVPDVGLPRPPAQDEGGDAIAA